MQDASDGSATAVVPNPLATAAQGRLPSMMLGPEPSWRPDPRVEKFAAGLARSPYRFTFDMLLAIAPSLLAIITVYDNAAGQKSIYIDGCKDSDGTPVPYFDCVRCNNDSPRFGVAHPEQWRFVIVLFSILSSIFLAGSTYGLEVMRDRADFYLGHGVYISSSARRNWLSALTVSAYVVVLSVLQVAAGEGRQQSFAHATLGVNGQCVAASPYANMTLTPTFSAGNPTLPTSVLQPSSWLMIVYFVLNTVVGQSFTIRSLFQGPRNLYTDASLRTALKQRHAIRAVQDVVRWQVLAADLDRMSRRVLLELSVTERPRRYWRLLRLVFAPLIIINYYNLHTAYVGVHPFDRTYRKREWGGRTMVEEVMHRLWLAGKVTPFRARDKPVKVEEETNSPIAAAGGATPVAAESMAAADEASVTPAAAPALAGAAVPGSLATALSSSDEPSQLQHAAPPGGFGVREWGKTAAKYNGRAGESD